MTKKSKRTFSIAIASVALIGSLGFAGNYAFAESSGDNVTVSQDCKRYADEAKKHYAAYEEAKAAGDDVAAKRHFEAFRAAQNKYKDCMN